MQDKFTDPKVSNVQSLQQLQQLTEDCSDAERTKWLSRKAFRDALATRLQQVWPELPHSVQHQSINSGREHAAMA